MADNQPQNEALEIEVALPGEAPLNRPEIILQIWMRNNLRNLVGNQDVQLSITERAGSWCRIRIENLSKEQTEEIGSLLRQLNIKYPIVNTALHDVSDTVDWEG